MGKFITYEAHHTVLVEVLVEEGDRILVGEL
jgi:hypothetical protein